MISLMPTPKWRRNVSLRLLMALLLVAACGGTSDHVARERPNLVVIVSDDYGYPYYGFMGSSVVRTPHLDRLASEGISANLKLRSETS
jgi:hypothetical protein